MVVQKQCKQIAQTDSKQQQGDHTIKKAGRQAGRHTDKFKGKKEL